LTNEIKMGYGKWEQYDKGYWNGEELPVILEYFAKNLRRNDTIRMIIESIENDNYNNAANSTRNVLIQKLTEYFHLIQLDLAENVRRVLEVGYRDVEKYQLDWKLFIPLLKIIFENPILRNKINVISETIDSFPKSQLILRALVEIVPGELAQNEKLIEKLKGSILDYKDRTLFSVIIFMIEDLFQYVNNDIPKKLMENYVECVKIIFKKVIGDSFQEILFDHVFKILNRLHEKLKLKDDQLTQFKDQFLAILKANNSLKLKEKLINFLISERGIDFLKQFSENEIISLEDNLERDLKFSYLQICLNYASTKKLPVRTFEKHLESMINWMTRSL